MRIDKITFTFGHTMGDAWHALIALSDGAEINAWYDPKTFALRRANSLPRDPKAKYTHANYRQRDLTSVAGRKLADDFQVYARKYQPGALAAHEAAKLEAERRHAAKVAEEQAKYRAEIVGVIMKAAGRLLNKHEAGAIVDALMEQHYIGRDPGTTLK